MLPSSSTDDPLQLFKTFLCMIELFYQFTENNNNIINNNNNYNNDNNNDSNNINNNKYEKEKDKLYKNDDC